MILKHDEQNHTTSSREAEPPPDPPSLVGKVTLRMGDTTGPLSEKSISEVDGADFWPVGVTSGRQVILVPLTSSDEVMAFGLFPAAVNHTHCCRVPFVARVQGTTAINALRQKLIDAGAEVGEYSTAPLGGLQNYITAFEQSLKPTLLSATDWKRDSSNEHDVARTAA
jgi:hypothetical protein